MSAAAGATPADGAEDLGQAAIQGVFWNISFALANKALTAAGQVALAWFLAPEDVGLAAMAASIAAAATLLTSSGMNDLLVQRHGSYEADAPQVLWLSLCLNLLALAAVLALAPTASGHFSDHRVGILMAIQAFSWPLASLPQVMVAKLRNQLRFKAVAAMNLGEGAVFTGSAVALAALGFGAYALVWPIVFRVAFAAVASWALTGGPRWRRPDPGRWPGLLGPGLLLVFTNFVSTMGGQLPNFIVGSCLDARRTGLYAWATLAASQAVFLLAVNLRGLFIPLFARLAGDPSRRGEAIARSLHVICAVVTPVCLLQALVARPMIALAFPARWSGAASLVAWLSLGLAAQPLVVIVNASLVASGRYARFAGLTLAQAALLGAGVWAGCARHDLDEAALGAMAGMLLALPLYLRELAGDAALGKARLAAALAPALLSLLAVGPAWAVGRLCALTGPLGQASAVSAAYATALGCLFLAFDRGLLSDAAEIRDRMLARRGQGAG